MASFFNNEDELINFSQIGDVIQDVDNLKLTYICRGGRKIERFFESQDDYDAAIVEISNAGSGGGGGEGGTSDYLALTNKPKINGVTLTGNKTLADLKMVSSLEDNSISLKTDGLYVKSTERVRLTTDGNHIYRDSVQLTFVQVRTLVMDSSKLVTLTLDDNVSFFPSAYDGDAIWFDAGFIEDNVPNQLRIIINSDNQVKIDQIELASKTEVQSKVLKLNTALSESDLLNLLATTYPNFKCSGFFYNTDIDDYCEFEGLYVPYKIGTETVHFGYCHLKGLHGAEHYADYYIDDEDGGTWHKKTVNDYIAISTENNNGLSEKSDGLFAIDTSAEVTELQEDVGQNTIDIEQLKETVKTLSGAVTLKPVSQLPTTDIKTNIIYLLETGVTGQFDQYIYDETNTSWVSLGLTSVDLSGYTKQEYLTELEYLAMKEAGTLDPSKDYNTYEE